MYGFIIILLLAVAFFLLLRGVNKKSTTQIVIGICLAVFTGAFFWFLSFWGEALWFESVGYQHRFWKIILTRIFLAVLGGLAGLGFISLLTIGLPRQNWFIKAIAIAAGTYIGGSWASANWDTILLFLNRVSTGIKDPILDKDTGFYLFALPFYNSLYNILLTLVVLSLIACLAAIFLKFRSGQLEFQQPSEPDGIRVAPIYYCTGALLLVFAFGRYLDRFNLMYSSLGAVTGPGWTDANVRLPAYYVVMAICIIAGLVILIPYFKRMLDKLVPQSLEKSEARPVLPLIGVVLVTFVIWFAGLGILPGAFQWLVVQPNEITMERPYIEHNIEFTRQGFALDRIEEERYPVEDEFTKQDIENNKELFRNIRLWDWRALKSVYKQFQEIRLYYEFADIDIDRYRYQDEYRQVMVSAREIQLGNLPPQSQTFVNKRFKYTHGIGITLNPVSEFTPEGLPNMLIKDIPPVSEYPELEVDQPRIYYGELTDSHVIVNSSEKELDYPSGEENVYFHYDGPGGVEISNTWRKFLFGWKFDGTRLFFSTYPTPKSRIMFHRNIIDRVKTIAPFLKFDNDPYITLINGKLYWIVDAYTVSANYPYSEPARAQARVNMPGRQLFASAGEREDLRNVNYIRNSVKAVIDAYKGDVSFYIYEEDDPLIQAWSKVFPNMFKSKDEMAEDFQAHVRYPTDLLLLQGLVYSKYHMSDPVVFYNQEDLWVRATENYYGRTEPVQPYYIMWKMPGSDKPEFICMMPFTPKNKQVLIGWIAGMSDPENYGRLLAYKFPKEKRVLGTQQVETKIDQDRFLSGQLSLWDQRGSRVIRGNVLVIPIDSTIIYVEPIYLQAETAAYPELRLVAVMHDDNLSYAETFEEALMGLVTGKKPEMQLEEGMPQDQTTQELIKQADSAFEDYLQALSQKQFDQAAGHLKTLSETLKRLTQPQNQQQQTENE